MTGTVAELLGALITIGTLVLLVWIAWDLRDGFRSMDARLARRDQRRAAKLADQARAGRTPAKATETSTDRAERAVRERPTPKAVTADQAMR